MIFVQALSFTIAIILAMFCVAVVLSLYGIVMWVVMNGMWNLFEWLEEGFRK